MSQDLATIVRALLDLRSPDTTACAACGSVLVTQEDRFEVGGRNPDVWCDRCAALWPREGRVEFPQAPLIRALIALMPPGPNCEAMRWVPSCHAWVTVWVDATGDCYMGKIGSDRAKAMRETWGSPWYSMATKWPDVDSLCSRAIHVCETPRRGGVGSGA